MKTFGVTVEDLLSEENLNPQETPAVYQPSESEVIEAVHRYFAGVDGCRKLVKKLGFSVSALLSEEEKAELIKCSLLKPRIDAGAASKPEQPKPSAASLFNTDEKTGLRYMQCAGRFIGVVLHSVKTGTFVLAAHNACPAGNSVDIKKARQMVASMAPVDKYRWVVPSDDHFATVRRDLMSVNSVLNRLGGDPINSVGFLSTTSQDNKPPRWNVRFVLPITDA